jgi:hypothetical protein
VHGLFADDITGSVTGEGVGIKAKSVKVAIDNKDIFSINGFQMAKLSDCEEVKIERKNIESVGVPGLSGW